MTSTQRPGAADIVVTAPMPLELNGETHSILKLHWLWEMSKADIDAVRERVRGVATTAHFGKLDASFMDRFPNLAIISSFGVRYDNAVDTGEARRRGIMVTNTPDLMNDEVADFIVGLLISTVRRFADAERHLRSGRWISAPYALTSSLRGRKVGIVGFGKVGSKVARRLAGFDVEICYFARQKRHDAPYRFYGDLVEMALHTDVLILCLPASTETKHIITKDVLVALGSEGVVINAARGDLISEEVIAAALRDNTILAAGLDVFEREPGVHPGLMGCDRVVLLPHIASASRFARKAMGQLVLNNLSAFLSGYGALTPIAD